jgi:2'-5' RNA ligase
LRTFIALELPEAVRNSLSDCVAAVRRHSPQSRWVDVQRAHLTLVFLGELEPSSVAHLGPALEEASRLPRFSLELAGGGAFGPPSRPRVLWVGVKGDAPQLGALEGRIREALAGHVGWKEAETRAFSAHVTLARARSPRGDASLAACLKPLQGVHLGGWEVNEVLAFRSTLGSDGATHTVLARASLRKP